MTMIPTVNSLVSASLLPGLQRDRYSNGERGLGYRAVTAPAELTGSPARVAVPVRLPVTDLKPETEVKASNSVWCTTAGKRAG